MDNSKDMCRNCEKLFSKKHLSCNIEYGIKKNVSVFRKHFKIDQKVIRDPIKFCKKCEKKWLPLNNMKGKKKIEEFINKMNTKDTSDVTLQSDEERTVSKSDSHKVQSSITADSLDVPGTSGTRKTTNLKVNSETFEESSNSKTEMTIEEISPGTSQMIKERKGGDFDYWCNLWKEKQSSGEVGPKVREEITYLRKKMDEAKKDGIAYDDIKDNNYWFNQWKEKFISDEAGPIFLEDMHYFVEKMKETDVYFEKE